VNVSAWRGGRTVKDSRLTPANSGSNSSRLCDEAEMIVSGENISVN
jgi:hypothetical protein